MAAPTAGTRSAVGDASLQFLAGALIALPGLITSAFGLLLLVRPIRGSSAPASCVWFVARLATQRDVRRVDATARTVPRVTRVVAGRCRRG